MPLTKYQLHRKSFQNSINLNVSSSIVVETQPVISEKNPKRQRSESSEETVPLKSTITILTPTKSVVEQTIPLKSTESVEEQQPQKKKTKTKVNDELVVQPTVISPPQQSVIEKETVSEAPSSFPSTNVRMRELKSKTPAWKAQKPIAQGNTQGNSYHFAHVFLINHSR